MQVKTQNSKSMLEFIFTFSLLLAFHSALQEFATPPATCDTSSKVIVDGNVEKNLCYVQPKRNAYNAKLHCERNGMQLYRSKSSPQALQALVTLAKTTLGNNKRIEVFVDGQSGNKCQALQGNGELIDFSCNTRSSFVCEYLEVTTKTKCSYYETLGEYYLFNLTGITSPTICYYSGSISNGNTVIKANASIAKESVVVIDSNKLPANMHLPINLASSFPNLQGLLFDRCLISEISYRSLGGLSQLRGLSLKYNKISRLDGKVFKDLAKLEVLLMSKNSISHDFLSDFHLVS
jgi:Leucine-rich repeat (LRR) protein